MPTCTEEERKFLDHIKKELKLYLDMIGTEFDDLRDASEYFMADFRYESAEEFREVLTHYAEA